MIVIERRKEYLDALLLAKEGYIMDIPFDTAKEAGSFKFKMYQTLQAIRENPEYDDGKYLELSDSVSISWRRRENPLVISLIRRTKQEVTYTMRTIRYPDLNIVTIFEDSLRKILAGESAFTAIDFDGSEATEEDVRNDFNRLYVGKFQRHSRSSMNKYAKDKLECKALKLMFIAYDEGKLMYTVLPL